MQGTTQKKQREVYLTLEQELSLARRVRLYGDQDAKDQLINAHFRLARKQTLALSGPNHPLYEDLLQEAQVGLLEAANRFDETKGNRFSTYANWWIRASLHAYMTDNWSMVRGSTSSGGKTAHFAVRRLTQRHGGGLTPEVVEELRKIGERTTQPLPYLEALYLRLTMGDQSMSAPLRGGEGEEATLQFQDTLVDPGPSPEDIATSHIDGARVRLAINRAMRDLTPRERDVFRRRRLTDDAYTLQELAEVHNVSRERIRQIEERAMEKFIAQAKRIMPGRRKKRVGEPA